MLRSGSLSPDFSKKYTDIAELVLWLTKKNPNSRPSTIDILNHPSVSKNLRKSTNLSHSNGHNNNNNNNNITNGVDSESSISNMKSNNNDWIVCSSPNNKWRKRRYSRNHISNHNRSLSNKM